MITGPLVLAKWSRVGCVCVRGEADGLLSCKACHLIPVWTATACSRPRFSSYSGARSNSMVSSGWGDAVTLLDFPPYHPPPHTHTVHFLSTLELKTELPRGGGSWASMNMLPKESKFPLKKQTKAASHYFYSHHVFWHFSRGPRRQKGKGWKVSLFPSYPSLPNHKGANT